MDAKTIKLMFDNAANVWIATSDDIPGLVLEDESLERLKERVEDAIEDFVDLGVIKENKFETEWKTIGI